MEPHDNPRRHYLRNSDPCSRDLHTRARPYSDRQTEDTLRDPCRERKIAGVPVPACFSPRAVR
jgi:hypothetical protein